MFNDIMHEANISEAFNATQRGAPKHKPAAVKFKRQQFHELDKLVSELHNGTYRPGPYASFLVHEPKQRVIFSPSYRDKIVQHMLNNVLSRRYYPLFIRDSYACIEGRGNIRAVLTIQRQLRAIQIEYNIQGHLAKSDISKFFYSIPHDILKHILTKVVTCPLTLTLLYEIIDSSPINPGLPLGNLTSQLFANIFLNELDQFCKRQLRIKHYVRYADDIVVTTTDKTNVDIINELIDGFLKDNLRLTLHPRKTQSLPVKHGVSTLGFFITQERLYLLGRQKSRIRKLLHKTPALLEQGLSYRVIEQRLNSWLAFAQHANPQYFIRALLNDYDFLTLDNLGRFRLR